MLDRLGGGTAESRRRLRVILETLAGDLEVSEACRELSLSRSRFHEIRRSFLERAPELLEPGVPGPVPRVRSEELAGLRREIWRLEERATMAELREELMLVTAAESLTEEDLAKGSTRVVAKKKGVKRRPRKRSR